MNQKFSKLAPSLEAENFGVAKIIDAHSASVIPGFVDTHAHINEPGRTDWEGFQSATRAAAAAGITTVVDMPLNSIPATTSLGALKVKRQSAEGQCAIHYAFWGGVVPGNTSELEPMIEAGVVGFKCFLCPSGVDEFPHVTRADLELAMPVLARHQIPLIVHAEIESDLGELKALSPDSYSSYLQTRPPRMELDAIDLMIELCEKYRCPVHIVHLSTAQALEKISNAKMRGLPFSVETCPHYLHFYAEEIQRKATHFKCAPPIRELANREALWEAVRSGVIDFIVSDHSPCTPGLKCFESGDFGKAWGGIAGLQMSPSVVWTEMRKRGFAFQDLLQKMSRQTSSFAHFEDERGVLEVGAPADIVIYEEAPYSIEEAQILHKNKVSPYTGEKLWGRALSTFVGGEIVYTVGHFENLNAGKMLKRKKS